VPSSALGALALADTEHLDQTLRQLCPRGNERNHEAEQPNTLYILLAEHAVHRAIRQIHHADQLVVVVAAANPEPRTGFIDRALVAAYDAGIEPLLLVTKADVKDTFLVFRRKKDEPADKPPKP